MFKRVYICGMGIMDLHCGKNKDVLISMPDNSFDSIVTDPPYELGFMGKKWDSTGIAYDVELWRECLRVLKPGGHLLAFSGTRTYHRMAVAIEDAGFEIRDMIEWVYGSGFPKSLAIGKAVDKLQGNERETYLAPIAYPDSDCWGKPNSNSKGNDIGFETQGTGTRKDMDGKGNQIKTKGTSEYEGWGTALKPAHETICVARKPLSEKNVAENCLKWGTGGINIDGSRVETGDAISFERKQNNITDSGWKDVNKNPYEQHQLGRFPANLIHDGSEEVKACFPENTSRFFKSIIYQAKASKAERGEGNNHPTVKPVALMEYLINMVTPPSGTVLDPFMGSGTTGVACKLNEFGFVGIDMIPDHVEIAKRRISRVNLKPQTLF